MRQFRYLHHAAYGSPEVDHDGRENRSSPIDVRLVRLDPSGLRVRLRLHGWREGFVTAVTLSGVRSVHGHRLQNNTFHYTLNQIPVRDVDEVGAQN